jgi:hypothetical protein
MHEGVKEFVLVHKSNADGGIMAYLAMATEGREDLLCEHGIKGIMQRGITGLRSTYNPSFVPDIY